MPPSPPPIGLRVRCASLQPSLTVLLLQSAERVAQVVAELHQASLDSLLTVRGVLELHAGQLVHEVAHAGLDDVERDPAGVAASAGLLHRAVGQVVEQDHVLEHEHRLVEGAVLVVLGERVLLQVVLLDQAGGLQDDLVALRQRVLAHQLHDLVQPVLLGQNVTRHAAHVGKLGVEALVEGLQGLVVLGVGNHPVHRGEMLPLRQLLVQAPEDLHDTQRGGGDRVGEITAGRGHGAHDSDGALAAGAAQALDAAGALVEAGQAGAEVGGVAAVGRHLCQATRDLTQRLGPARGGVCHHGEVVAHVAEVLGERDAGVDGRLARCDGHVGGVGHQRGALHDALLAAVRQRHRERGELVQHLRHLIAALAAADVDDAVRVGKLGERLANDGLAAAKGAGDGAGAAQHGGEEGVQHALPRQQRVGAQHLLGVGARGAHGPQVHHLVLLLLALKLELNDLVLDVVLASRRNVRDAALGTRRQHQPVVHQAVLVHQAVDVAARREVAHLERLRLILPKDALVQGRDGDAARDEAVAALLRDGPQRALDAVENLPQQTRAQLHRQRGVAALHQIPDLQACRLLVTLDGGGVALQPDDLANQVLVTHAHQLVHRRASDLVRHHHRAGNLLDDAALPLGSFPVARHGSAYGFLSLGWYCAVVCGLGPPSAGRAVQRRG
mmetsp:Transcript_16908/g.42446  ORF Transcript_16908/g.42446 Transcript_16908/m.42446 type:complete len:669 (+) Transcript_16908:112-2118(+)